MTSHRASAQPLPTEVDVLIAGGGPSGLFLALDLAQRGITSHVLEPRVEMDWTRPRAKTTNARTMTHLRRIGLAERLRDAAPLSVDYAQDVIFCSSLAGHELTRFPGAFQLVSGRYDLQPECGQQVAQPVVEKVLRDAVNASERAHLHLGAAYVDSTPVSSGRDVVVREAAGANRTMRCRYLIGADGVSSAVRRSLGVRLEGNSATKSNLGVLFRSDDLGDVVGLDPAVQYWVVGNRYAGMVGPLDRDGLWWSIIQGYDPEKPQFRDVSAAEIVRSLIGVDADVEVIAEDPWTARMLLSPTYREDAVFLVGDAAHANPPWGGHGFNTCIGDAANLAWKLAAVLQGWAGPQLLDSYETERRPVARRTIDEAAANGSTLADDVQNPNLEADGHRGLTARAHAAERLAVKESEFSSLGLVLGYHYAHSPLVTPSGATPPAAHPIRYQPTAAPGCLLPHVWLSDGRSIYDTLGPEYTLLATEDVDPGDVRAVLDAASSLGLPLRAGRIEEREVTDTWEAAMVLVRPDQHVAWRGVDAAAAVDALRRAAGHPVTELVS